MIIMGIDPGLAIVGFGVIAAANGVYKPIDYGVITTDKDVPTAKRLTIIADELSELIEKYKPDEIAVEELFYCVNQKTVIPVAEARGVILYTLAKHGVKLFEYTPMQIKLAITGYGNADKKSMQQMVTMLLNLRSVPKPDDAADAVAIALTHAQTRALGTLAGYNKQH